MKRSDTINRAFRDWTRGVSFTLTMGKTQTAQLVSIVESKRAGYHVGMYHRLGRLFVAGLGGLQDRGLIRSAATPNRKPGKGLPHKGEMWVITRAGILVVELLRESGVYRELAEEMRQSDREHNIAAIEKLA